ncbi:ubiquitin carboxyl-terminal hydrolase 8-like isoform X2 [Tripterygium wilfordii]|uniref:ubiquitin carboxyl-terminal hydrolase 8-like isoform X2 n=1 Tax=Tripterygium wilfordii TaxID=458696 RepID=UPI0018F835D2|nr:ubiquitin carboxyl-terminal hydrolase 8-like isoform X2 [Tripterygium wilfordii]
MTRVLEKLGVSVIAKSTNLLANLSVSTLRHCTTVARLLLDKTLALLPLISMEDLFFSEEDSFLDFDSNQASTSQPLKHNRLEDDEDYDNEKLYFVPYSWWRETQSNADHMGGILFIASSNDDADDEIVLSLKKEGDSGRPDGGDEVCTGLECVFIPEAMWLRALKWHNDSTAAVRDFEISEDHSQDVFPIQIRISLSRATNSLLVKIKLKLHIWDFSRQTTHFFVNERVNFPSHSPEQSGEEVLLLLQFYGFSDSVKGGNERKGELAEYKKMRSSYSGPVKMNGETDTVKSYLTLSNSFVSGLGNRGAGFLGLTGLQNIGNTCFMNSAIQCLAHTPKLVDYFLGNYQNDINYENPLGMKGALALAFGYLLRRLWAPGEPSVAPRMFKLKLAKFSPQFSGYNQHDSHEFLAFLLDGLHEDLNRVKCKPYIEAKDAEGRPDEEVAEEYWQNHLTRNDSVIVDLCQGQYRSRLLCPVCKKVSVTFDPFMYLSLPLPSPTIRNMTLTVFSTDGNTLPSPVTVTVPKYGRLKDLIEALSTACSLGDDETLLVAEIYKDQIFRLLEEPNDSLALIRDDDKLVAYRLPRDGEGHPLVVFMHERVKKGIFGSSLPNWSMFGTPLVARSADLSHGFNLRRQLMKLLNPFLMPSDVVISDCDNMENTGNEVSEMEVVMTPTSDMEDVITPKVPDTNGSSDSEDNNNEPQLSTDFRFFLKDKDDTSIKEIRMNDPLLVSEFRERLNVHIFWPEEMIGKYDISLLSSLPEVFKPQLFTRRPMDSVSLYKCLEAFLKEDPLGPEDMWNCPSCKTPQQASKKLDLWRLPEILVIHLKRFSYSQFFRNKLETYVDFPTDDLDLSTYISYRKSEYSHRYMLYALSNHYGGMGGGHYTAFVKLGHCTWYEFDDDRVIPISQDRIKTSAAYILFYRRVTDE